MRPTPPALLPNEIRAKVEVANWRNAVQVLTGSYPSEWEDLLDVLVTSGIRKRNIPDTIDAALTARGWSERQFVTKLTVDGLDRDSRIDRVDHFRNRVGLSVEWKANDRCGESLDAFRILFGLQVLDVGIIVTRSNRLHELSAALDHGFAYGSPSTLMERLLSRDEAGRGAGGCPVLVFGIGRERAIHDSRDLIAAVAAAHDA